MPRTRRQRFLSRRAESEWHPILSSIERNVRSNNYNKAKAHNSADRHTDSKPELKFVHQVENISDNPKNIEPVDSNTITRLLKRRLVSTTERYVMVTSDDLDLAVGGSTSTSPKETNSELRGLSKATDEASATSFSIDQATIITSSKVAFDPPNSIRPGVKVLTKFIRQRRHRAKIRRPKGLVLLGRAPYIPQNINEASFNVTVSEETTFPPESDSITISAIAVTRHHSTESLEMCRICHGGDSLCSELGKLVSACSCRGTVGRVHVRCLERWLTESDKSRCELCGCRYDTKRVHRYGVLRALLMWAISQNTKQLLVDGLGIALMTPIAVLAAWLSSRTLAGLMANDKMVTSWPLASTFVLACMTLVLYYCWIISAATRHAIGWWSWYRSQYDVHLQSPSDEGQSQSMPQEDT